MPELKRITTNNDLINGIEIAHNLAGIIVKFQISRTDFT